MDLSQITDKLFQACKDYEVEKEQNINLRAQLEQCEGKLQTALHVLHTECRKRKDNDEHHLKSSQMNKLMRSAITDEQEGIEVSLEKKEMYLKLMFTSPEKKDCGTVKIDQLRNEARELEEKIAQIKLLLGVSANNLEVITARRARFIRAYQGKERFTPKKEQQQKTPNVEMVKRDLFNDDWNDDEVDEMLCECLDESEKKDESVKDGGVDNKGMENVDFEQEDARGVDNKGVEDEKDALDEMTLEEAERLLDDGDDDDKGNLKNCPNDNKMQANVTAFNMLMK